MVVVPINTCWSEEAAREHAGQVRAKALRGAPSVKGDTAGLVVVVWGCAGMPQPADLSFPYALLLSPGLFGLLILTGLGDGQQTLHKTLPHCCFISSGP